MAPRTVRPSPSSRWRWALAFAALAAGGGGAAAWWLRPRPPDRDPGRLELLRAAAGEFQAGHLDRARELLDRRAAEVEPTALDWMLRARLAEARGRVDEAIDDLARIPDTDPIAPSARLKEGQLERARHRARAAEAHLLRAIQIEPDQVQARRELAYLYALQHRRAECDEQFRELARRIPLDYRMAFAWLQGDLDLFDPDEAIRALIPMVEADPDDRMSRLALAHDYRSSRRYDQAEAILAPLPDSDPDARAFRSALALDRGDPDAAARLAEGGGAADRAPLENRRRRSPSAVAPRGGAADRAPLENLRGKLALRDGDPARASGHFRAALRLDPDDRDALQGLGTALRALDDPGAAAYSRAAADRDRLRRLVVECGKSRAIDGKVLLELGDLCEKIGRDDQARAWYGAALAADPGDARAVERLERLDDRRRRATELRDAGGTNSN